MIHLTEHTYSQPTLALFFGGTGILCGRSFETMLETLPADHRQSIEYFFVDSQEPAVDDHHRARHYCYKDLNEFFTPVYEDFVALRFPENLGRRPVVSSCDGCGVTRIFGATSLVSCRDDFLDLARAAVLRLKRTRRRHTNPIQVFLTASSCGGTGAGMIIDAAALLRHLFDEELGETPRIQMFLLGPEAFFEDRGRSIDHAQRRRMQASSYALLKELQHFAQGKPFVSSYRLRDERIEISNASDDDRLFDWVYYLDGRRRSGLPARSVAELAWTVAEAQLHFAVTEVGRRVSEAMPNQREERVRKFPADFVEPHRRNELSEDHRRQLAESSRATFLASFSVRNVRFPAPELAARFRARWVLEAVEKAVLRGTDLDAQGEEFDRVLGYDGRTVARDGLLAELGLTKDGFGGLVEERVDRGQGLSRLSFEKTLGPGGVLQQGEELLQGGERLLRSFRPGSNPGDAGLAEQRSAVLDEALAAWRHHWNERFPSVTDRLHRLAWDPVEGRGVRWLNDFVLHAANVLTDLSKRRTGSPGLDELQGRLSDARNRLTGLSAKIERDRSTLKFKLAQQVNRRLKLKRMEPHGKRTLRGSSRVATLLQGLQEDLVAQARRQLVSDLSSSLYRHAADALRRWREERLAPMITTIDSVCTLARRQCESADVRLTSYQGESERGPWVSHTTTHLVNDELLGALEKRVARNPYSVERSILGAMLAEGLRLGRDRLSLETMDRLEPPRILEIIARRVEKDTAGILSFLDGGWLIDEARGLLPQEAAKHLDAGAQPLVSFQQSLLGRPLQGSLVVPRDLILPQPFGRSLGRMNRLVGRDPLRLTLFSVVYGIPPNALDSIGELFSQYRLHLGDELRLEAHDRYPLHVFRGAASLFDEPHSPLDLNFGDDALWNLVEVGRGLGLIDGSRVGLTIRDRTLPLDHNLLIELCEEVLLWADRSSEVASRVFDGRDLGGLQRLFDRRKHVHSREPGTVLHGPNYVGAGGGGNGSGPTAHDPGSGHDPEATRFERGEEE